MKFFNRTPRSVSAILGAFHTIVDELNARIEADQNQIEDAKAQIEELNLDIAQAMSSQSDAIAARSRINEILGK